LSKIKPVTPKIVKEKHPIYIVVITFFLSLFLRCIKMMKLIKTEEQQQKIPHGEG